MLKSVVTFILIVIITPTMFPAQEYPYFDGSIRDTLRIGCPEYLHENDSIYLTYPIYFWSDMDMVSFSLMFRSGKFNRSFWYSKWEDASIKNPVSELNTFILNHSTYNTFVHLSIGDDKYFVDVQNNQKELATYCGNITFAAPESLVDFEEVKNDTTLHGDLAITHFYYYKHDIHSISVPYILLCNKEFVTPHSDSLIGNYSFSPDSGYAPLQVDFFDKSYNRKYDDTLFWYFNDGDSITAVNPCHVYEKPGIYFPAVGFPAYKGKLMYLKSPKPIIVLDSVNVKKD